MADGITLKDKPPVAFFTKELLALFAVKYPWLRNMAEEFTVDGIIIYRVSSERVHEIFPDL